MRIDPRRCRNRVGVFFLYGMCVICLEYVIVFHHLVSLRLTEYGDYDLQTNTDSSRSDPEDIIRSNTRNMSPEEVASFMVGINASRNSNITNVTSAIWDQAKLHMIQMRLSKCVQETSDFYTCLEEEYIKERVQFLKTMKKNGNDAPPPTANVKNGRQAKGAIKRAAPTDDPVKYEQYFKKRTEKVYPYKFDTVLTPKHGCDNDTFMILLVHSFHPYADRRTAIRNSWGGVAKGLFPWPKRSIKKKIKFIFVLGTHTDDNLNHKILNESRTYDDILQGNFTDAYVNMTYKSLLGLKYVSEECPSAKYLVKSDDDMIVNLPHLVNVLEGNPLNRTIMGPLNRGSKVYRSGKWKVKREDYPFIYYPPYESGAMYIITNDIVRELYDTAEYVPQFHVDDAYITGILGKIIGVEHAIQAGFPYWTDKPPHVCDIIQDKKIAGTKMTPAKLKQYWQMLAAPNTVCPSTAR